ncbi:unnamed protein product [Ixodes pacificus]
MNKFGSCRSLSNALGHCFIRLHLSMGTPFHLTSDCGRRYKPSRPIQRCKLIVRLRSPHVAAPSPKAAVTLVTHNTKDSLQTRITAVSVIQMPHAERFSP